jgi:hypothetical protein
MSLNQPFTREALLSFLDRAACGEHHLHLLRWLIWLPLLSTAELSRLVERTEKTVAASLKQMEEMDLVAHIVLSEPDGPPHFRYYVDDLGLYVFAARAQPPLSVPRLAQAYAIDHDDLLARVARPDLLRSLADVATRLIAEGRAIGYPLVSYQQPWAQADTIFGKRQTLRFDAALLIRHPQGTEHACYLRMDPIEDRLFPEKRERKTLTRLVALRDALLIQHEHAPRLLIVTQASRLLLWAELLSRISDERTPSPIAGGITLLSDLSAGIYAAIWWPFDTLRDWSTTSHSPPPPTARVPLADLLGPPTSPALAERFSQRETFAHLLTERAGLPLRKTRKPLPTYVGPRLDREAQALHKRSLADALILGTRAEQRAGCALLSLVLSGRQKEILTWLAHHPLLTLQDLAAILVKTSGDIRVVQRHLSTLDRLALLVPFQWWKADLWQERERYLLSEAALRYTALREGLPAASYLLPAKYKKNDGPLSIQSGSAGLFAQMGHTSGLYRAVSTLVKRAHGEQARVVLWKNAREAIRWYRHPFGQDLMQVRPDAELLYLLPGADTLHSVLLEYDRATTFAREYEGKFSAYADYQEYARAPLPPIAVITQSEQSARLIRSVLSDLAVPLQVVIVLEETLPGENFFHLLEKSS